MLFTLKKKKKADYLSVYIKTNLESYTAPPDLHPSTLHCFNVE